MIILADKEGANVIRVLVDAACEKGVFKNVRQAVAILSCVRELPQPKSKEAGEDDAKNSQTAEGG